MIIDTSALVAVIRGEPEAPRIVRSITSAMRCQIGSPTLFEAEMVVRSKTGRGGLRRLAELLASLQIEEIPFGPEHRTAAEAAFTAHGKGRSPTRLNFGNCMAYAMAKVAGQPLLTLDAAFAKTDVELVPLDA